LRILYLAQLVPYPPDAGAKVRIYYTLRYLARQHEVTLLAFSRPDDSPEAIQHLSKFCTAVHTVPITRSLGSNITNLIFSLLDRQPFIIRRDFLPAMMCKVDELLSPLPLGEGLGVRAAFDALHADQIYMIQYALRAKKLPLSAQPLLVVDKHNVDYLIFQRLATGEKSPFKRLLYQREWRHLQRFEAAALAQFDQVVTVTDEDRQILEELINLSTFQPAHLPTFHTIPICVDTEAIPPVISQAGAQDVLYLGGLLWPPNVEGVLWFARQVWPLVQQQVPHATFTIAGKNPPPSIQALATSDFQPSNLNLEPKIHVTGYVPDPQPYLENAAVFIVPLFSGSGMRVKIVDAWRWGLPVVSTSIGAEGIQYQDGENILIADDPQSFAGAVIRLLTEPDLNQSLRINGRRWVEEHYDWQRIYPAWDKLYPPT
jgi:glycosyltransferase involved in cell wall biosynthesis